MQRLLRVTLLALLALGSPACEKKGGAPGAAGAPGASGAPGAPGAPGAAGAAAASGGVLAAYPGTDEGARQLLTDIRKDPTTAKAMTLALKPTSADYRAVYTDAFAATLEREQAALWSSDKAVIGADPANSELELTKATSEEIKAWSPEVRAEFPGGYQRLGSLLKPGVTIYRWKYLKPGETLGMAFDGLAHVNGHWVFIPKPFRHAPAESAAP